MTPEYHRVIVAFEEVLTRRSEDRSIAIRQFPRAGELITRVSGIVQDPCREGMVADIVNSGATPKYGERYVRNVGGRKSNDLHRLYRGRQTGSIPHPRQVYGLTTRLE